MSCNCKSKNQTVDVKVKKLDNFIALPNYAYETDSGLDLYSAEDFIIYPNTRVKVPTGIAVELPPGYEIQVRSRSGMASNGVFVTNSPGTVDNSYTGQIFVLLTNLGTLTVDEYLDTNNDKKGKTFIVNKGQKIAQMVVSPVTKATLTLVDELKTTSRSDNGFGSTDRKSVV